MCVSPSGVDVSFERVEGLSSPQGLGWCSGDLTMADMRIWWRAWAGVEVAMWSCALKWAAVFSGGKKTIVSGSINLETLHTQGGAFEKPVSLLTLCFEELVWIADRHWLRLYMDCYNVPSSLRDRSSILIFWRASSSSPHLERSFSKASFMSLYCKGTAGWGWGVNAPLVVVPTSSRRRPKIPCLQREHGEIIRFLSWDNILSIVLFPFVPSTKTEPWP